MKRPRKTVGKTVDHHAELLGRLELLIKQRIALGRMYYADAERHRRDDRHSLRMLEHDARARAEQHLDFAVEVAEAAYVIGRYPELQLYRAWQEERARVHFQRYPLTRAS